MENRKLKLINNKLVINNETCFNVVSNNDVVCQRKNCRQWLSYDEAKNCALIAAKKEHTFESISTIFGCSRMRIYQIQQKVINRLKNSVV